MVHLLCGKICSGKTTYAKDLQKERNAVILSCDEVSHDLFDNDLGTRHDEVMARVQAYLLKKAAEIAHAGVDVILDWGFWTEADRRAAAAYFEKAGLPCTWHYVKVSEEVWHKHIQARNAAVSAGASADYYVDAGLLDKLESRFQEPTREAMDVWYEAE